MIQEPPLPPLPPQIPVFFDPGPPVGAIIAVVAILAVTIVAWPLIRAYARRLERGSAGREQQEEIDQLRTRVAELEPLHDRVAELEGRLDFAERMLTQRAADALPRGDRP